MTDYEMILKHKQTCGECKRVMEGLTPFCSVVKFLEEKPKQED